MAGSVLRGQRLAVSLLLALWAITAIEAGPDSVTSFDNRPPGSGSTPSSSASSGSSAPGSSSTSSSGRAPAASASSSSSSSLPGPLSSSRSSSSGGISCNSKSIIPRGNLSVAKTWSETAPLSLDFVPLPKGQCVGWTISAEALAETDCADKSAENYILVEFWQLGDNTTISGGSIGGPGSGRSTLPKVPYGGPVVDVKVLAARGTKPSLTFASDGQELNKVIPPIRDPTTGLTPVGSFQDDAGVVYNRPVLRVMFPTDSPVTDVGDPGDPNSWYVTIANMPDQEALPAYAIRASCININPPARAPDGSLAAAAAAAAAANRSSSSSSSSSSSKAPASLKGAGMPCPVPSPGGKQCNGHGTCRTDTADLSPEYSRYCACDAGWGSWGCQLQLLSLPLNAPEPVTATIPPGKWGYWEVTLPAWQGQGPMGGPSDAAAGRGSSGGSGGGGSNEQLLLMAERVPGPGMGGNPLLFLKPFDNKDHNEPTLDEMSLAQYADLRSFQLQLNRQFINYRLPLRESRGPTPGSRGLARPRRWYVAIYNSNASRLSEPARVKLWVQYRDLTRQNPACPFDCNGRGRCLDPLTPLPGIGMRGSALPGTLPQGLPRLPGAAAPGGDSSKALGLNPDLASLIALGPLQDLTPMDVGFMCACNQGFGGLMCEGRVQNLTVGSGEQKAGPEVLEPGAWSYYVVTIDSGFNPNSDNLGIQWIVGQPSSPPSNYSNAYISFDQGPLHRQQQLMGMSRQQVRRGMTPYSKLVVRSNPPLPLQVPGGQLSPGGTYVVSVFNNDYVVNMPFIYSLAFYVMAENQSYLHPYMSILLGVTAAVILCLAMTLCKRVVVRYGFVPWRWRQRRRQLQEAAAAGAGGAGGPNSLALVLMAQGQPASRGVPPEIYNAFPCRPYAVKEFQKRQHEAMQQQEEDSAPTGAVPAAAAAANDTTNAPDQGTRRSPTAAATAAAAAAAATAAANAAALDAAATGITAAPAAVDLEAGRTPPAAAAAAAATASPAAAVAVVSPASGASPGSGQWWRLPNLHWSSTAAASRADPTAAAANAPQASPAAASVKSPGTAGTKAGADAAAAAAAAAAKDSGAGGLQEDFDVPTCAVCLCEYSSGELVRQLPCNHEFHQSCIDQWMVSHGTCPICRAPLWAGALEDQAQADDGGSNGQEDNDPAAIYVHHELGAAAGREGRPPRGLAGRARAVGDREWVRALRQWRERNRQQQLQRQQRHQPHADEAAPATVEPASPMATWQELAIAQLAIAQMQQQQEALAVHSPPSQQQPLQQQQPQQPPHLAAAAEAASDAPAAGAAGAGAGGSSGGSDTFMGAFSLGRRRQQRDQGQ